MFTVFLSAEKLTEPIKKWCKKLFDLLFDVIFAIAFYGKAEDIPPITDGLLLESATNLAEKIRTRKVRSVDVIQSYIKRINEVNPVINAVVNKRFEEALKEAEEADELVRKSSPDILAREKPFLGVPVTAKNSIGIKGLLQDAGVLARKGIRAMDDSASVSLMRRAGAIPIAITNVPELCLWFESYNNLHGVSKNPYDTRRTAGGSSSGEGCLISAAGSVIGIGTDIAGSIRVPAAYNGIFGHKPSSGVVPSGGTFPSFGDTIKKYYCTGPMCRYSSDLLPMLKVLAGPNRSLLKLDSQVDVSKVRIFYMEDDGGNPYVTAVKPEIKEAVRKAVHHFESTYGTKATRLHLPQMRLGYNMWLAKMALSNDPPFAEEFTLFNGPLNPYVELIKWLFWLSPHTLSVIMITFLERWRPDITSLETLIHNRNSDKLLRKLQGYLKDDGVFIYPVHPEPAPYHYQSHVRPNNFTYTGVFSILGLPSTVVPMGLNENGLPVAVQVVGSKYNDHLGIAVAGELEKAFGGWKAPSPVSLS